MTKGGVAGWAVGAAAVGLAAAAVWAAYHHALARQHWRDAELALERQDAEAAREHLARCLPWWGGRAEVRLAAARAARLVGDYDDAEGHLAACESQAPDDPAVRRERALLQLQQGDFRGHVEAVAPAGLGDPGLPADVLAALARGYADTFYKPQALECAYRLFRLEPEHPQGRLVAGQVYFDMKYYDQAVEHFERAVRRLPDARAPRLKLAACLLKLGEAREADRHLRALEGRGPDDPDLLLTRAWLHEYRGQIAEARSVLDRLLELWPTHGDGLVERGQLEFRHGDANDAVPWLRQAVAAHPGRPDAWLALVQSYEALGQSDELRHCQDELARVNRELGELTRLALIVTQEKADDVGLRAEVAERYERLGDPDRAIPWRICALQLDPAHRPTHAALAGLFDRTGQPHRAARHRALAAAAQGGP